MSSEIENPCIGVCSQNVVTGQCHGCQRTPKEILDWPTYTDDQKETLANELEKRLHELFGN